jgi:hypothetical protein
MSLVCNAKFAQLICNLNCANVPYLYTHLIYLPLFYPKFHVCAHLICILLICLSTLHYDLGHFPFLFWKTWIDNLPSPILIPRGNVLKHCTPSRLIYISIYVNEI